MNTNTNTEPRYCTFSFFDQDVETMLYGSTDKKLEEHELELIILKLWNTQEMMRDVIGMELAQA